jgi:hypothetical protein
MPPTSRTPRPFSISSAVPGQAILDSHLLGRAADRSGFVDRLKKLDAPFAEHHLAVGLDPHIKAGGKLR